MGKTRLTGVPSDPTTHEMKKDINKYLHRELSWLEFNRRVLEEAKHETVPLLERVKFQAIFSSNLDELFTV
jgi:polyphosphate kinase